MCLSQDVILIAVTGQAPAEPAENINFHPGIKLHEYEYISFLGNIYQETTVGMAHQTSLH